MTKKQKEDMVKEMEQFINEGVPEHAKDKECIWEEEPPIHTYAIETRQIVSEKDNKKRLDVKKHKDATPSRLDNAVIKNVSTDKRNTSKDLENDKENEVKSR